ncbi:biotin carboxylase N-terminal domain-containing protein [Rhodococcus sp. PSBB049]|uniref:acetyl-CoA carboxylase biotin carboxylase subunit n=1 Tax=Rhodococcus sp. PSBB049 TaxID=2812863 RepID=UPI0019821561|nr:biotin carboxylase N-terminal domain-containing protein [Rhodococcus sp. PSBB049]QSE72511.1 hypothetical protein JYA91_29830 [Rhodococcus sp. PSBB049]
MFTSLLVANRGEIAVRIIRTARRLGIRTVAVFSDADRHARHVLEADEAVHIGASPASESYLRGDTIVAAALNTGVQAVHPGYGFLSENPDFARQVLDAGLAWVGPEPEVIAAMGDKISARNLMAAHGVPISRGTAKPVPDTAAARDVAADVGYPLMVKAAGGGGGIGMTVVRDATALPAALDTARNRALRMFGSAALLFEQYIEPARHVEVQILGLNDGRILTLGERDCSIQRRFQKVIEETPCPALPADLRERMLEASRRAGAAVSYRGAGTVEYLVDVARNEFVFLEMNTRIQVEHPVTELVTGIDLVEAQLLIAAHEDTTLREPTPTGHAIELRIYAEDPVRMLPAPGDIEHWAEPTGPGIRVDGGYRAGDSVTPHYDPLLAKLCISGPDRGTTLDRAREALAGFVVTGIRTNIPLLSQLLDSDFFDSGDYHTQSMKDLLSASEGLSR